MIPPPRAQARQDSMRGHFITFEGGEGSGKSTHAATLAQRLKSLGIEVVLTREPGGSTGAEIIRHILLSGIAKPLGAETEAILFAAARDDHVRTTILPALRGGQMGDLRPLHRFNPRLSGRARQGRSRKLIRSLERVTVGAGDARAHLHSRRAGQNRPGARQAPARHGRRRPLRGGVDRISRELAQGLSRARRQGAEALRRHRRPRAARHRGGTDLDTLSSNAAIRTQPRAWPKRRRRERRRRRRRRSPAAARNLRAVRPCRRRAGAARKLIRAAAFPMPG